MANPSITCSQCGLTSYNENDIRERYCGRCHKFHKHESDYSFVPPSRDPAVTPENLTAMRAACLVWLTVDQRETIARAIDTRNNALIAALAEHGGRAVDPKAFAELLLQSAVSVLDLPEDTPDVGL